MTSGRLAAALCLLTLTVASPVGADPSGLGDRLSIFPGTSLFVVDLDGSFRFRTELWHQMDMGLYPAVNGYGVVVPQGQDPSDLRETADFRLRLQPALHISERATIHMDVDLFAMGAGQSATSDFAAQLYRDYGMQTFSAFDDPLGSARVRALWVDFRLFHALQISLGRVPMHWGMGILENNGAELDSDGGDAWDGATFRLNLDRMEFRVTVDWPFEGTQETNPYAPWGAAYDVGDKDDLWQWRLHFLNYETGQNFRLDWGIYARFLLQEYSSPGGDALSGTCVSPYPWLSVFNCDEMFWRDAFIMTPDFWIKATFTLPHDWNLTLEGELLARYGTLSASQRFDGKDTSKTLYGVGGVFKAQAESPKWALRFEFGAASGDKGSTGFGILDANNVAQPDDSMWEDSAVASNHTITSLALHPNYHTDLILFRRVIGGVTNAWYVKPSLQWTAVRWGDTSRFFIDLATLYAAAFVAEVTPGNASPLGVETDLTLGLDAGPNVSCRLQAGMLFPMAGLADGSVLNDPLPWTVRMIFAFPF